MSKGEVFRALHEQPGAFIIPNPWDVGSARILAALGFPALATTSAGMAFSLGFADGQVTREVALAHCEIIVRATDLPVSADLEKGFGDSPEAVAETVRAAALVGLAGCSIEDHTGDPANPIYPFEQAVARIAAAVAARDQLRHDFVLTARCENLLWGRDDLDDTIRRLRAFSAAGADVLYAPGLRDLEAVRRVCDSVDKPVNVIAGLPGTDFSLPDLAAAGAKRISIGSGLARAAYAACIAGGREMIDGGAFTFARSAAPSSEIESLLASGAAG
ncbi:MAG: isocitrate lyase/phosphoenolpyruvate mutase family protein [Thermomicrobiales bacterium]